MCRVIITVWSQYNSVASRYVNISRTLVVVCSSLALLRRVQKSDTDTINNVMNWEWARWNGGIRGGGGGGDGPGGSCNAAVCAGAGAGAGGSGPRLNLTLTQEPRGTLFWSTIQTSDVPPPPKQHRKSSKTVRFAEPRNTTSLPAKVIAASSSKNPITQLSNQPREAARCFLDWAFGFLYKDIGGMDPVS